MAGSPRSRPMELGDVGPPTAEPEECDTACEACETDTAGGEEEVDVAVKAEEEGKEATQAEMSSRPTDLDDDEGDLCRICRTPGEDESPLFYPCACSGSIKYVHQDCLLQWLNHSNARKCEVCKHPFAFSPVYAADAPARLPFLELILGLAIKSGRGARFFVRLAFVLSVWLLFIPFTTFWIWRFTFVRSFAEAQRLFVSRCVPSLLLTDCLHGFLLSAGIIFIFLGATSLREYFRHLRELNAGHEEEGVGANRGRLGRNHGALLLEEPAPPPFRGADIGDFAIDPLPQGLAGAGQLLRRNAENVAAQLEIQAARLEAHVEQMFDAVEDADGAEDVPFDELVGMQGPVFHLVENAITVLASNAIFLGLVALVPFTLGRLVLSIVSRIVIATGSASAMAASALTYGAASTSSELGSNLSIVGTSDMPAGPTTFDLQDERLPPNDTLFNMIIQSGLSAAASFKSVTGVGQAISKVTEAMVFALKLSDAATVAVGYAVLFLALSFYLGLIALIRYSRGEPVSVGQIHRVATMAEAAPSMTRQMMGGVKYVGTMVKVAFLLVTELGLFPLMCGWWLDVCTLEMLEVTVAERVSFFYASPITSSLLHWLAGIVYMLQISIFVSLLREVLRPGVLYFLRDPADPNYNPFRDLIDDPVHKHVRRVLLSVVVYGSLIVMLVFLPVRLAISVAPLMFPLDIRVSDPFTEIPADMLLFHICIPFAVEHFRPRATIKCILVHWFSSAGWALSLLEFLLPGTEDGHVYVANNQVQQRRGQLRERVGYIEVNPGRVPVGAPTAHNCSESSSSDDDENAAEGEDSLEEEGERKEYKFALRIVVLLLAAWMTLLLFNTTMLLLPISIGRTICASFLQLPMTHGAKCNDLYAFNIGCYVLWATAAAARYVVHYLQTHDLGVLLRQVLKWSAITAKSVVLLFLWIVVIPVLIGILFELVVVVPLRVPVDESPVFLLYQDWALGLVFLKIWTRLVMLGQRMPLVDDSWRVNFEQVRADGFARLRGWWVFTAIILPVLARLLTALCIPYALSRGVFALLGYSLHTNSALQRFAWFGCLLSGILCYGTKKLHKWFSDLHNAIRDDRYLVGRRLHNFADRRRASALAKQPPPTTSVAAIEVETRGIAEQEATPSISGLTSARSSLSLGGELTAAGIVSDSRQEQAPAQERERVGVISTPSGIQNVAPVCTP